MSGLYEGTDLVDKTFYGFRLDSVTGHLDVEVLDGGDAVVLPQEGFIDPLDYKQWVWSQDTLNFEFIDNGNLLLRIV